VTDNEDAELLQVFLEEAREHLDGIEGALLQLESSEGVDFEIVNRIFRAVHSVKGGAGFFGLVAIKTLSHAMESVLGSMQKGQLPANTEIVGVLLGAADSLVHMIDNPAQSEDRDIADLVRELERIGIGTGTKPTIVATQPRALLVTLPDETTDSQATLQAEAPAKSEQSLDVVKPLPLSVDISAPRTETKVGLEAQSSIRVHVGILDRLMTLAAEQRRNFVEQFGRYPKNRSHYDGIAGRDHVHAHAIHWNSISEIPPCRARPGQFTRQRGRSCH
jgi:two-component system chemotaxis sensor kinase CheA